MTASIDYARVAHELDGVPYGHAVIVTRAGEVGRQLFTATDRPLLDSDEILVQGRSGNYKWTAWAVRRLLRHDESGET